MENNIYEVVKEYKMYVEAGDFDIKGRILKRKELQNGGNFKWEISHYYKPSEGAGVYYPSSINTNSFEDAEHLLFAYMIPFTTIGVKSNKYY